ncbi:large ribosomal subunit protein uL22m-like [Ptychodera flava]|uniref:large ribosomal subunit protein uL22m-like n=1 Tax=Ptychodera flava TaxID=63121 RepID=UPI00396A4A01
MAAPALRTVCRGISLGGSILCRHSLSKKPQTFVPCSAIHTSAAVLKGPKIWEAKNKQVFPPQKEGEEPRLAEIYHCRRQIKYSPRKMWYIATFIKDMWIDDALAQLQFVNKKGAGIVREVLLEAQEKAMQTHNVEFKSNLHIARSFVGKGLYEHAVTYHGRGGSGMASIVYSHYFVKLKEGPPPPKKIVTGHDKAKEYIEELKQRTIIHGL